MMHVQTRSAPWWVSPLLTLVAAGCDPGNGTARAAERVAIRMEPPEAGAPAEWTAPGRSLPQELPEGVTAEMVSRGQELFRAAGFCYTCHGQDGRGVSQLGADLGDDEWTHGDGSYQSIVQRIRDGITAEASTVGVPMPPRGGARLSDEEVRAVAAYVWTLSRSGT